MNFSAKLKGSHPPNYIFNFNIDIPLKYKSSITTRSNQTSPTKSPGKLNQKKYKLSSITPRPTTILQNTIVSKKSQKKSKTGIKCKNKIPKTMKQQFLQKDLYQINNFNFYHQQNNKLSQTQSISRKTQKIPQNKKNSNEQICPSRKTVKNNIQNIKQNNNSITIDQQKKNIIRNISILQKLITDEHNIKYTTDSSQLKKTQPSYGLFYNNNNQLYKLRNNELNLKQTITMNLLFNNRLPTIYDEQLNMNQIRQYEQISTHRKQRLNYQYLKQKILFQSSVRKIQRAWRNYQTKKLVYSYSNHHQLKIKNQIIITSSRSQSFKINNKNNSIINKNNNIVSKNNKYSLSNHTNYNKEDNQTHKNSKIIKNNNTFINNYIQSDNQNQQSQKSSDNQSFQIPQSLLRQNKINKPFIKKNRPTTAKAKQINNLSSFFDSPQSSIKSKPKHIKKQYKKNQIIKSQSSSVENIKNNYIKKQSQIQQKLKKFQEQQIKKWEIILQSIKKGNNIQNLLQKSQRFKKQLQNNLKSFNVKLDQNRASPILFRNNSSKSLLNSVNNISQQNLVSFQPSPSSNIQKSLQNIEAITPQNQKNQYQKKYKQKQLIATEQRRKQKILFFQNQILKIDNQDYSDISSVTQQSINDLMEKNRRTVQYQQLQQRQKQQNIKLRKKLELFNTHFLDFSSNDQAITDRSLKPLKGQSSDQRRATTNNRLMKNAFINEKVTLNQKSQQILLSEQNRRPDVQIFQKTLNKTQIQRQRNLSKINELINKKIQYPSSSQQQNSLIKKTQQQQDDSDYYEDISDHHFDQPALTYRQRKYQVPQLNLNHLASKNQIKQSKQDKIRIQQDNQKQIKDDQSNQQLIKKKKVDDFLANFQLLNVKVQKNQKIKKIPKVQMKDALKLCSFFQEQLMYQVLLEFSDSQSIVYNIKKLFQNFRKQQKKPKPEGICTNLQSIKDYLENFVGFVFENKLQSQIEKNVWTPNGPSAQDLLKYLRKDSNFQNTQNQYIMSINIFEMHWKYAHSNIYFDRKYTDEKTQIERVNYLKGLTRVYFRAIFDAFNQSLEFGRSYGLTGQPYPWSKKLIKERRLFLKQACQSAYRRILKLSVVYCGVHFDQRAQLVNEQSIKQIQEERLLNLLTMQLEQDQYRWSFFEDQLAQVKYDLSLYLQELILGEVIKEISSIIQRQIE